MSPSFEKGIQKRRVKEGCGEGSSLLVDQKFFQQLSCLSTWCQFAIVFSGLI